MKPILTLIITLKLIFFSFISASIENMSIEVKVGQLLMVHFNGATVNDEAQALIEKAHVGSFIYYQWANELSSPKQVQELSRGLQKIAQTTAHRIPLFIATDQEGGRVSRLKRGFTAFPSNQEIGLINDPQLSGKCSEAIGSELKAVGINMNLAPVADVNSNPTHSFIGTRSYGPNPFNVSKNVLQAVRGYHKANVVPVLKHFPGIGDVQIDSHVDLPILNKSLDELLKVELIPFLESIRESPAIMTAHLLLPQIDPVNCVTHSSIILQKLLREKFGYRGLIMSDSLVMEGVLKGSKSIEDAALKAIQAGCDIIILGGRQLLEHQKDYELKIEDILKIHARLVSAVKNGEVSAKRLDESVTRIISLKKKFGLWSAPNPTEEDISANIMTTKHRQLVEEIASKQVPSGSNL